MLRHILFTKLASSNQASAQGFLSKMSQRQFIILILLALSCTVTSEVLQSSNNVGVMLLEYEKYIDASLHLDKTDRALMSSWMADFQVKQVNITSHYRLEMTRDKEQSFRGKKTNLKWKDCVNLHQTEINRCTSSYLNNESECLKTASSADTEKVKTVHQVEKEIRKWRKSYRYLSNVCKKKYPDDQDEASLCLVEYIKRDNYDVAFQRLILLKLEAMDTLLVQLNSALSQLEECLKMSLLEFLNTVRNIMTTLHTCYSRINKD